MTGISSGDRVRIYALVTKTRAARRKLADINRELQHIAFRSEVPSNLHTRQRTKMDKYTELEARLSALLEMAGKARDELKEA